jgi:hypothetical protein
LSTERLDELAVDEVLNFLRRFCHIGRSRDIV